MIKWEQTRGNHFQTTKGIDEFGNKFQLSANLEIVTVTTYDGFTGCGWTTVEALSSADYSRNEARTMQDADRVRLAQLRAWGYEILSQEESDEFKILEELEELALERGA